MRSTRYWLISSGVQAAYGNKINVFLVKNAKRNLFPQQAFCFIKERILCLVGIWSSLMDENPEGYHKGWWLVENRKW